MALIKAVIFDFAGVVGSDGYWVWLRKVVPDIEKKKALFSRLADRVDKGLVSNEENIQLLSKETGVPASDIWPQIFREIKINYELLTYLDSLRERYELGILSNFTYPWLEEIIARYKLGTYFRAVIISSKHGFIKPEPKAFETILTHMQVTKEEAVFVDDRQMQVDASNALGLRAFLYTTVENLRKDLGEHGVSA